MRHVHSNTSSSEQRQGGARIEPLRYAYFAQAGEIAIRYGVVFDRVVEHVRILDERRRQRSAYSIRYVEDLVHAVACTDGVDLAWNDLSEQHERVLLRVCAERYEGSVAIVLVRRFLATLRRESAQPGTRGRWTLRRYDGTQSLRRWLRERLLNWTDACLRQPKLVLVSAEADDGGDGPSSRPGRPSPEPGKAAGDGTWPIHPRR